jgi:hypothetical protein
MSEAIYEVEEIHEPRPRKVKERKKTDIEEETNKSHVLLPMQLGDIVKVYEN